MKIQGTNSEVTTSGLNTVQNFKIAVNGKAFKILLDGIYPNKIKAVVRELCTNAFDAHSAAKKRDVPFNVHIPTNYDPVFRVRDYGVSMSNSQVLHLYSTLFESSKENTNTEVGMLGLGSKSPFAYVDAFTTIAWMDGKKRTYRAWMGEDGVPKIALLGEEDSEEPQGIEVSIDVNIKDVKVFKETAESILKYFTTIPNITGGKLDIIPDSKVLEGESWYLKRDYNTAYARQGCVVYPINSSNIPNLSPTHSSMLLSGFVIDFPIGTLDVAPSREELSYGPQTCSNIIARLNTISDEISKMYSKEIDEAKTYWEACSVYSKLVSTSLPLCVKEAVGTYVWNGKSPVKYTNKLHNIITQAKLDSGDNSIIGYFYSAWDSGRKQRIDLQPKYSRDSHYNEVVYGVNYTFFTRINNEKVVNEAIRMGQAKKSGALIVISADTEDGVKAVIDALGNPEYKWTRDLDKAVIKKSIPGNKLLGKTKKEQIKARKINYVGQQVYYTPGNNTSSRVSDETIVELDGDAYYIETKNGKPEGFYGSGGSIGDLAYGLEYAKRMNFYDPSIPIYLVSKVYNERVDKFGKWKKLEEVIVENALKHEQEYKKAVVNERMKSFMYNLVNDSDFAWFSMSSILNYVKANPDTSIAKINDTRQNSVDVLKANNSIIQNTAGQFDKVCGLLGYDSSVCTARNSWKAQADEEYSDIIKEYELLKIVIRDTYPLLQYLPRNIHKAGESAVEYIKTVDENIRMRHLLSNYNSVAIAAE